MKIISDELSKLAYQNVKGMILSKQLVPGQKIVQEKLADELGISRTPLRSALEMLEAEYLIKSIPRKGVIVREFTNEEIIEIYDCRIALENTAVQLFTTRATDAEIEKLKGFFDPFKNVEGIDALAYQIADSKFHDTIIKQCGNNFLYNLFQKGNLLICIDLIGLIRPPHETLQEHTEIITAIQKRDPGLAGTLIKVHLDKSRQLIIEKTQNG